MDDFDHVLNFANFANLPIADISTILISTFCLIVEVAFMRVFMWHCSLIFFQSSKICSMVHHGSVGESSEQYKRNLTLTLTLNILLTFIVFHNKITRYLDYYGFIIFTAYFFIWGGNVHQTICHGFKVYESRYMAYLATSDSKRETTKERTFELCLLTN